MNKTIIYLDHAAGTPVDPEVFKAMEPWLREQFGNPSASSSSGKKARSAVDSARRTIAEVLNCAPQEIIFTSGGTESNNIAIQGSVKKALIQAEEEHKNLTAHIITSHLEHPSIKETIDGLITDTPGAAISFSIVQSTSSGEIKIEAVRNALHQLQNPPVLISLMFANNEIGTINPIAEYVDIVKKSTSDTLFHTDACQATGFLDMDVQQLGVDLMSLNASKIYGPQGVGALYIKEGVELQPMQYGGGQERGIRPGTENVAGIVGFAKAVELANARREEESKRLTELRNRLRDGILSSIPDTRLNGDPEKRLPNNVNIHFAGVDGEALLFSLDQEGIEASLGSACAAGSIEPSPVLLAMGLTKEEARSSVRFTLGRSTIEKEIETVLEVLPQIVNRLRLT